MNPLNVEDIENIIKRVWDECTAYWAPEWSRDDTMISKLQEEIAAEIYSKLHE